MIHFYSQKDIAILTGEHQTTVARLVAKHQITPSLTVGVRMHFSEADKNRLVKIVRSFRTKKNKDHKQGDNE